MPTCSPLMAKRCIVPECRNSLATSSGMPARHPRIIAHSSRTDSSPSGNPRSSADRAQV